MSKRKISICCSLFIFFSSLLCNIGYSQFSNIGSSHTKIAHQDQWTIEKANQWQQQNGWLRGCNYIPSTAINQLEMWQAETFDTTTINRELGWAENIGFNSVRVFLHHLAWEVDKSGFKSRMNTFLSIANKHHIKTIFVFFDDCWNPNYHSGKQPIPKPGIHNSGWVRDPGDLYFSDSSLHLILKNYIQDILSYFKKDNRIILWDLYNEVGSGYGEKSFQLLQNVFGWARSMKPSQPLTAPLWDCPSIRIISFLLANSDVITYHNYRDLEDHAQVVENLEHFNRPLVCTEYMGRKNNSLFSNIMPFLKQHQVGAISWGFVEGKTNTKYGWGEPIPNGQEPPLWFHDLLRKDGSPYKKEEVDLIKKLSN